MKELPALFQVDPQIVREVERILVPYYRHLYGNRAEIMDAASCMQIAVKVAAENAARTLGLPPPVWDQGASDGEASQPQAR